MAGQEMFFPARFTGADVCCLHSMSLRTKENA